MVTLVEVLLGNLIAPLYLLLGVFVLSLILPSILRITRISDVQLLKLLRVEPNLLPPCEAWELIQEDMGMGNMGCTSSVGYRLVELNMMWM